MVTIIKTEFMKLKRYFIVWIGVSLMLLTVLLTLFTTMADDGMVWDYQFLFEQVVKHFVTMIFPMCITLISGYMISREYTDDTLKNIETLPISFRKLLAGKLIVSAILSLFLGIVCFAFTVVANFIMGRDLSRWFSAKAHQKMQWGCRTLLVRQPCCNSAQICKCIAQMGIKAERLIHSLIAGSAGDGQAGKGVFFAPFLRCLCQ